MEAIIAIVRRSSVRTRPVLQRDEMLALSHLSDLSAHLFTSHWLSRTRRNESQIH